MATMAATPTKAVRRNDQPRRMDIAGSEDAVDKKTLGGRMAWARIRQKISQKDLAAAIPNKSGKPKSRATINQYEMDKIQPPLDVVEIIAKQLKVSPSFIAFGETHVSGPATADVELVSFNVITFGKNGPYVSDTMAFTKDRLDEFGISRDNVVAYVMSHDAPAFDLLADDVIVCDKSITIPDRHNSQFVIKANGNMEIIEFETSFVNNPPEMRPFKGPDGQKHTAKLSDLTVLGAVVTTIR